MPAAQPSGKYAWPTEAWMSDEHAPAVSLPLTYAVNTP